MSTSSLRRLQERGGGNVAAPPTGKASPKPISTGKENPTPTPTPTPRSRSATQKPRVRHMARIDKSAAAEEPRSRWSSLSAPKGRSSTPSEFTKVLSDLRKTPSRVPLGPTHGKGNRVNLKRLTEITGKNTDPGKRVSKDVDISVQGKERVKISVVNNDVHSDTVEISKNLEDFPHDFLENEKNNSKLLDGGSDRNEQYLSSISEKKLGHDEKSCLVSDLIISSQVSGIKPCRDGVLSGLHSKESKIVSQVSNSQGTLKGNAATKNPSKLQEKIAFLEGKVKKIASDLNRTKEILDLNNPDASKMMLSDIQEKIVGIEKTMVHVGSANKGKTEEKEVMRSKISVKSLSAEELEARLFPHHKLLRYRTLLKSTSRGSENEKKVSSLDENEIASEFLASLSKESKSHEADEGTTYAAESDPHNSWNNRKGNIDALLMADEKLYKFDDQEIEPAVAFDESQDMNSTYKLMEIGYKTSTAGWFVSEGESVILAHDDGSCSFYDIANSEIKAEYKPPKGIIPHAWQDCWIIRAPNADGSSGRYVVAATKGDSVGTGFCSWDFYSKDIHASHFDDQTTGIRTPLAPLSNNTTLGRNTALLTFTSMEKQWWYKPCGPLLTSAASCQRTVCIYDIRDGEQVMEWELEKPMMAMDCAPPLHWRNRGKVVIAQSNGISLWDVNSLSSKALMLVSSSGRRISALHVNNTDAELGGGVRQRLSSLEAEGNDGVFCTPDSINVLDFRLPSGIALKIPKVNPANVYSAFSHGDSVYIGCSSIKAASKNHSSQIQEFSLRSQRLLSTFALPEPNARHSHRSTTLTQVWGNSSRVMGVCGLGLFVFNSVKDNGLVSFNMDYGSAEDAKEVIGPDDMCCPSFDYLDSRVLLISNDRPAQWRYLL